MREFWLFLLMSLPVASALAQPGTGAFVPGHVYVSEIGTEGCFEQRCWIREIDPETGESWIFADYADGLCDNSGLRFTPDGLRLRVLNLSNNTIQDYDANGNGNTVYSGADGLGGPFGGNGLFWDGQGAFFVANEYSNQILRFACSTCQAEVVARRADGPIGGGGLAMRANESFVLARQFVLRILVDRTIVMFDDYGSLVAAHAVAFDRHGNLYVGAKDIGQGGTGVVRRYCGTDPATREVLISGLTASDRVTIELSADESTLYYASFRNLLAIDIADGTSRVIFTTPREDDFVRRLGSGIAVYKAPKPGDMNCDNWVNNFDIDPFVLALTDAEGYQARFGWCDRTRADVNRDGEINNFDIDAFVAAVVRETSE